MELMGGRISLTPRPRSRRVPVLEAVMLGHCPGRVRTARLTLGAREEMRRIGFGEAVDHLDPDHASTLDAESVGRIRALHHLPIPLLSAAELEDLFPDARDRDTGYESVLAGRKAWLLQAVEDFFANGGEKLWVVPIPEEEGQGGFLGLNADALKDDPQIPVPAPTQGLKLHEPLSLRGIAVALAIPEAGVLALPDLERLQVPERLEDPTQLRLANPEPAFLPCSYRFDDGHRERANPDEKVRPSELADTLPILDAISRVLAKYRPDMQCLYTLPLVSGGAFIGPGPDAELLTRLASLADSGQWPGARRIQMLYPYLRGRRHPLVTGVGLVAGMQSDVSRREGPWRSVAGRGLRTDGRPYPLVDRVDAVRMRETPGVGILIRQEGRVMLEDERLMVPVLHPKDYEGAVDPRRFDGYRSAEVARFMGYLMRQLRAMGEALVFDTDPRDPRPGLLLDELFRRLHNLGALRGAQPEEAFDIRVATTREGAVAFDIEIAPAFPLDKLHLTFFNRAGAWQARILEAGRTDG